MAPRRLLPALLKTLAPAGARGLSTEKAVGPAAVISSHTGMWMLETLSMPDPMEALQELIEPRLAGDYPIDSVLKIANLAKSYTHEEPQHEAHNEICSGCSRSHGALIQRQ